MERRKGTSRSKQASSANRKSPHSRRFATGCLGCLCLLSVAAGEGFAGWRALGPGMELGTFAASKTSGGPDSAITVVRIDPELWDLELAGISAGGESAGRTAKEWCRSQGFTAATNAGMFATDYTTHVGYLRSRGHVKSDNVNAYRSVAAFDPKANGLPRFRIFDLDAPGVTMEAILRDYASAVQNLRLIKRSRLNRWSQQEKKWSEAALGEDEAGRILLIFCLTPFTMYDLNEKLLSLDLNLVCAQHLEGGPEAQLYLRLGQVELELFGRFETSLGGDTGNAVAWPIPNILGVRPRVSAPR